MRKRVNTEILEHTGVRVSKQINNTLYFESNDEQLKEDFGSFDVMESVAALMRLKQLRDTEDFWSMKFHKQWNVSAEKTLFWLTGGNKEWSDEGHFKYKWGEVHHIFLHKYSDIIYEILDNSETLGDIRQGFKEELNLPKLYEFALNNGLIK